MTLNNSKPVRYVTNTCILFFCCTSILTSSRVAEAGKNLLVPVNRDDGTDSAVYQKVIVTSALARLTKEVGEKGLPIDAFSFFYRLKTDDGKLDKQKDGKTYWRVGSPDGDPLGYICTTASVKDKNGSAKEGNALREWNTRFVLDPQQVATPDRPFELLHPKKKDVMATYKGVESAGDNRALAFVTGEPNADDEYPLVYYIGKIRTKAATESGIDDLGIDIAFVLEMSDFMQSKWPVDENDTNPPTTLSLLTDSVRTIAKESERSEKTRGRVAMALVQYQDTREEQDFVVDVASDFVLGSSKLENGIQKLRPKEIKGDWPEDGLAGIETSINKLKWRNNTTKHIILIGSMSVQTKKQGEQESQWGSTNNFLTDPDGRGAPPGFTPFRRRMGWSSTGHNMETIVKAAHRGGSTGLEAALGDKTLHAILLGKNIRGQLDNETWDLIDGVITKNSQELTAFFETWEGPSLFVIKAQMLQRTIAEGQYRELAENGISGGKSRGLYIDAAPTREGVMKTGSDIAESLETAFGVLESSLSGKLPAAGSEEGNVFSNPIVAIATAYINTLAETEAVEAIATPVDKNGREVAKLKVFVFRKELKQLESTLDNLYEDFSPLTKRSDRQNVGEILTKLKRLVAESAAGQEFNENTPLDRIIGDLPLKTPVLNTTAASIAKMPSEDYSRWVNQLRFARDRCKDLYDNGKWTKQTSGIGEEYGFLEKSRLP